MKNFRNLIRDTRVIKLIKIYREEQGSSKTVPIERDTTTELIGHSSNVLEVLTSYVQS